MMKAISQMMNIIHNAYVYAAQISHILPLKGVADATYSCPEPLVSPKRVADAGVGIAILG